MNTEQIIIKAVGAVGEYGEHIADYDVWRTSLELTPHLHIELVLKSDIEVAIYHKEKLVLSAISRFEDETDDFYLSTFLNGVWVQIFDHALAKHGLNGIRGV